MYIVLEGIVGSGKSTQTKNLHAYLSERHPTKEVVLVREPGGTEVAEAIRLLVQGTKFDEKMHRLTDAYLYAAARAQLLHTKVKPVLDAGGMVVADRSFGSSLSYQGYVQGLGIDRVREINKQAIQDVLPDMMVFMDLNVEEGLRRTFDEDGDKRESMGVDFFRQARDGYKQLASFSPTKDIYSEVDATGSIEEVFGRIVSEVDKFFLISQ